MTAEARGALVEAQSRCALCTSYTHKTERCHQKKHNKKSVMCKEKVNGREWGKEHDPSLHRRKSVYCHAQVFNTTRLTDRQSATPARPGSGSFFAILSVLIRSTDRRRSASALMLEGNGSTDNFITHELANKFRLVGSYNNLNQGDQQQV